LASSTRIAIVSDTHGEVDDRVVEEALRCDLVVHAGDVGTREVLDALDPGAGRLIAVRGNNDVREKWRQSDWELLESLPWEARLPLPGGEIVVVHGHRYGNPGRSHARMRRDYPEARLVVYGHSHRRCEDLCTSPWILNPGAAGRVRTFGGPTVCLLEASAAQWRLDTRQFPPANAKRAGRPGRSATV
jgi:putative phosphoesterase